MRPYLAIIGDSFIEAAQSRVLWVLLIAWLIILAAIAPFSLLEGTTIEIQTDQIRSRSDLMAILIAAADEKATPAQQSVWDFMDPSIKQQIADRKTNKGRGHLPTGVLVEGLNSVLDEPRLYSEKAWPTAARRSYLKDLLAVDGKELSSAELQRRNRELLELAFPTLIRSGESDASWIGYAGITVSDPLPWNKKQIRPFFEGLVLQLIFKIGLGLVGIFIGIVVTSSMIPDLFQVGSLHLLLSKPISRSWLLIAKFVGGTCFFFINVAFLLTGFYFLVGIRLGFWNYGILLCIPVFVFVFMIYYSVSMLTGLIWRNAIVSIVLTILFWGVCTTVGITYGVMQGFIEVMHETASITQVGDAIWTSTNNGQMRTWDSTEGKWQEAFGKSQGHDVVYGPFWIEKEKALYYARPRRIEFGGLQTEDIRLQYASIPELSTQKSEAHGSEPKKEKSSSDKPWWSDKRLDSGPILPARTRRIIRWEDSLAVLTDRGLHCLDLEAAKASESKENKSFFGQLVGRPANAAFPLMTPEDWYPEPPMDICYSKSRRAFYVYSKGQFIQLKQVDDQKYEPEPAVDLGIPGDSLAFIANNHSTCLVASNRNGLIKISLDEKEAKAIAVPGAQDIIPRDLQVSLRDGSFALVDSKGYLWSIDSTGNSLERIDLPFQGEISAIAIDESNSWTIAHHNNQITRWNPEIRKSEKFLNPPYSWVERIYYGIVRPLYFANPKPAAVDSAIQRLLTDGKPLILGREAAELKTKSSERDDPWFGIWSNALFILVMLGLGCWYMHRQDL
jgi:ABC-type transport system involved in multi-copper enzyme maturation permease subunit